MKILEGLFKRLICLPLLFLLGIMFLISFATISIPYWLLSGRDYADDMGLLFNYSLSDNKYETKK